MDNELLRMSAVQVTRKIKNRELAPSELMKAVLDRAQETEDLNAFITIDRKKAMDQSKAMDDMVAQGKAKGKLFGLPVSIKDNIFTKGIRTTNGSASQKNFIPNVDDRAVKKIKNQGGIIFGKTNMPEFGCGTHGTNKVFGPARNPWNPDHSAGGSSGGAAAAIASGTGRLALGTDAGGSARIPASFCGIYGFKPQNDLIIGGPGLRPFKNLGHICPMTFSVADCALFLDALADEYGRTGGHSPKSTSRFLENLVPEVGGLKIGFSAGLGCAPVRPEIEEACKRSMGFFEDMHALIEEIRVNFSDCQNIFQIIARTEWHRRFSGLVARHPDKVEPGFAKTVEMGGNVSIPDYRKALKRQEELKNVMYRIFDRIDILACPVVSSTAIKAEAQKPPEMEDDLPGWKNGWNLHSLPFSLVSLPAASVPCGMDKDGLPIGIQLVGRPGQEQQVLNASAALEQAAPWGMPF